MAKAPRKLEICYEMLAPGMITEADVRDVRALARQFNDESTPISHRDLIIATRKHYVFVARSKQPEGVKIVGLVCLIVNHLPLSGLEGVIEDVIVDKNFRGRSIARNLLKRTLEFAQDRGVSVFYLTSSEHRKEAHALYESLEFKPRNARVYELEYT